MSIRSRQSVSSQDQGIKNPRAKALWDKWRHVWMMAWERDRRLKDKLGYLSELEKVKNFNWDEWRKRFLKHNNNKKSRVTDLFRKLDEDADGFLTRYYSLFFDDIISFGKWQQNGSAFFSISILFNRKMKT